MDKKGDHLWRRGGKKRRAEGGGQRIPDGDGSSVRGQEGIGRYGRCTDCNLGRRERAAGKWMMGCDEHGRQQSRKPESN